MSRIDRRSLLVGAASAGLMFACPMARSDEPGLRQLAASKGMVFGSLIHQAPPPEGVGYVMTDPAYAQMAIRECGLYVSTSVFWKRVAPTPTAMNFSSAKLALDWAEAHGMAFRGHTLVWHYQTPDWFEMIPDRAAAARALQEHIRATCANFAGKVLSWDVVNEAILTEGGVEGLRKNVFFEKIGPEYLDIAFHAAREADPKALLTLNDNNVEYATAFQLVRRRALLAVVDGLLRRGTPIDAIGIQSHLSTAIAGKLDQNSLASFLKEISDRNLKIMVTEMDAIDVGSPSDIAARDTQVASLFKRYLDVVVDNRATIAIATWGLSDKESWIARGDLKDFRRSDGLPPRPLPFDDHYRPKKAYYAIAGALHAAPNR
jgi:endo-1,4-beta-xylanase